MAAALIAGTAVSLLPEPAAPLAAELRLDIATPSTGAPLAFALSPEGTRIVYSAAEGHRPPRLWLRTLATGEVRALDETEGANAVFWSPDGASVGFFSGGALYRLNLDGTRARRLAMAPVPGGTWGADNVILFVNARTGGIAKVNAEGGEPEKVTTPAASERQHRGPRFLPDGRQFTFLADNADGTAALHLASVDSQGSTSLTGAQSAAVYHPAGWLLFVRGGSLVAQRLDVSSQQLVGEAVPVAAAPVVPSTVAVPVSVAANGLIAYRFESGGSHQLQWFDREGNHTGDLGEPTSDLQVAVEVAPDGRRALTSRTVQGKGDVWVVDAARASKLTDAPGVNRWPVWLHDGRSVIFDSERDGFHNLYRTAADGSGGEELVLRDSDARTVDDVSPDGRLLLFRSGPDLAVLPLDGTGDLRRLFASSVGERTAQFSPDGHWIAYQSGVNGTLQVFVSRFPEIEKTWPVSVVGGTSPRWSADGREVYFIDPDGVLNASAFAVNGDSPAVGFPAPLFRPRTMKASVGIMPQYDVAPDGRFLVNVELEGPPNPITLIVNWRPPGK